MGLLLSQSISLRNILFATDFSSCSEAALTYAIGLSRRYDSLLNIVSVVPAEICDNAQPPDPFYFRHSAENKMANLVGQGCFMESSIKNWSQREREEFPRFCPS
jgi:nucleotide-binding universal stress UspA family protein